MAPDQESDARVVVDELPVPLSEEVCALNVTDLELPRTASIPDETVKEEDTDSNPSQDSEKENFSEDGIPTPNIQLHQPEEVRLEWTKAQKVGAGLVNLGNSCFLNTVMQCLTYCPPLVNYLLQEDHSPNCKNFEFCMICELTKHIKQVFQRPGDVIKPQIIHQNLKFIAEHFQIGRQEDAHEFLRFVIENLWRASLLSRCEDQKLDPASRETTIINHIFGGYNRSQVRCLRCKKKSDKYEHFMDFILDIKHNSYTLEKALENFVKPELLENDNAYNCPKCKSLVQAEKTFTIHRAPNVATIQLKRFDYSSSCVGKVTKHISYPEKLNLRPYMSDKKDYPMVYKLNAVLVHAGQSYTSGHYYCYIKNSNDYWYLMDDTRVQRVGLHEVLNQQAYVLFYLRLPVENGIHFKKNGIIPSIKDKMASKNLGVVNSYSSARPQRPFTLNLNRRQASAENNHKKAGNLNFLCNGSGSGATNGHESQGDRQKQHSFQNGRETYSRGGYKRPRKNVRLGYRSMRYSSSRYNYSRKRDHVFRDHVRSAPPSALKTHSSQPYLPGSNFFPKMNGSSPNFFDSRVSAYDDGRDPNENCFQDLPQDFTDEECRSQNNSRFANGHQANQSQYNKWPQKHKNYPPFDRTNMNQYSNVCNGDIYGQKSFSASCFNNISNHSDSHSESRNHSFNYWNGNCSSFHRNNAKYSHATDNFNYKHKNSGYNGNIRWNNNYRYERFHYDKRNYNKQNNRYSGKLHKYKTVNGFSCFGPHQGIQKHPCRPIEVANRHCPY